MKLLIIFLLPVFAIAQNIKMIHPEVRQIETDFDEKFVSQFNSPQSWTACRVIHAKLKEENRSLATDEEMEILKYCPDFKWADPWTKPFEGCSWYCGGKVDTVTATASLEWRNEGEFMPWYRSTIHDLNYGTAWRSDSTKNPVGQYLKYFFNYESIPVPSIVIVNGFTRTEGLWQKYSRVKKIRLWVNKKPYAILHLKDNKEEQVFTVPRIGNFKNKKHADLTEDDAWTITFEIIEIYQGKVEQAAITEIYFDGYGHDD